MNKLSFLESKYLYAIVLLFCIAYPLAQSFERRLQYFRKWKYLLIPLLAVIACFIPWDIAFTDHGVWWFNEAYFSGLKIINLPVEECLFFICVPFACVFIYEVLNYYVKHPAVSAQGRIIYGCITLLLAVLAVAYYPKLYTGITASAAALFSLIVLITNPKWASRFFVAFLISLLPFLLVNGALTGMFTEEALVNYNEEEIVGLRIFTIPIEDAIYNFLMLGIVISLYEIGKSKAVLNTRKDSR